MSNPNLGSGDYGYQKGRIGNTRRNRGQDITSEDISGGLTGTGVGGNSPIGGINRQPSPVSGSTGWGSASQTHAPGSSGFTGQGQGHNADWGSSASVTGAGSDYSSSKISGSQSGGWGTAGQRAPRAPGFQTTGTDQSNYGHRSTDLGIPTNANTSSAAPGEFSSASGAASTGNAWSGTRTQGGTAGAAVTGSGVRQPGAGSGSGRTSIIGAMKDAAQDAAYDIKHRNDPRPGAGSGAGTGTGI